MSLPLRLQMTLDGCTPTLYVPFHSPLVNVHAVGNFAVCQAVNHAALQRFPVPCVVAPFVNAVVDFSVGGHAIISS